MKKISILANCQLRLKLDLLSLVFVLSIMLPTVGISDEIKPFGIVAGSQPSNYDLADSPDPYASKKSAFEKMMGNTAEDYHFEQYIMAPSPHPDFTWYKIQSTQETGICSITASESGYLSRLPSPDLFLSIKTQLEKKYGRSVVVREQYPSEFGRTALDLPQIKTLVRANWKNKKPSPETLEISEIELRYGNKDSLGGLEVFYKFSNFEKCQSLHAGTDSKSMEDGSSKF